MPAELRTAEHGEVLARAAALLARVRLGHEADGGGHGQGDAADGRPAALQVQREAGTWARGGPRAEWGGAKPTAAGGGGAD